MPLTTTSPQHSFVNFEHKLDSFIMPAYGSGAAAFQILLDASNEIPLSDIITAGISDDHGHILFESSLVITNVCAWGRIKDVNFTNAFPLTIAAGQPLPEGVYNDAAEFYAALRSIGYGAFDKDFIHCCPVDGDITFSYNAGLTGQIKFFKGLQQITIPASDTTFVSDIDVEIGECFYYFIKHSSGMVFSNNFKRLPDDKFITKVTYSSDEDAYGFLFKRDTMFNQVWLPLISRNPLYPETRKVYLKSNKQYKVQSSSIEKEYQCKTDRLPEMIHEKIVVLLSMDNVRFENRRINSLVYKKDDYSIDWSEEDYTDIDTAVAKFKVQQPFEGRNSNCDKRKVCTQADPEVCVPVSYDPFLLPDAIVGQFYNPMFSVYGTLPVFLSNKVMPDWMNIMVLGNNVIWSGVPTAAGTNIPVSFTLVNCVGAATVNFSDTIDITAVLLPSMNETSNEVSGATRTQIFAVGANVSEGNVFRLMVYSHDVSVTAVSGDTPTTIAQKLAAGINATTQAQWNDHGAAPFFVTGFPPAATSSSSSVTITLNSGNQFAGSASVY